jgi:protein gp37
MKNSNIEWTDHTFNPWIGCTKVSPGCAHCYAETLMATRYGRVKWGKGQKRERTSEANWKKPCFWNTKEDVLEMSRTPGPRRRPRVFCASLADWLDEEVDAAWLADLLVLVHDCANLDWLLLSKRPQNWRARLEAALAFMDAAGIRHDVKVWIDSWLKGTAPANVWIGTTVEDQQRADERIPALLKIPARVRFLSCEPLLESLQLQHWLGTTNIHWVICGGESGPGARPMHPDWARSLRDQCQAAGVAFFFKQWGNWTRTEARPAFCERADALFAMTSDGKLRPCPDRVIGPGEIALVRRNTKSGRLLDGREHNAFPV